MARLFFLVFLFSGTLFGYLSAEARGQCSRAANRSTTTQCAEEDNINIPFYGRITSFTIEATHPTYTVGTDSCEADFSNCPPPDPGFSFTPGTFKLFDDGETVVEAVREASWWRPNGMAVSIDTGAEVSQAHYVRVSRKIVGANEWPQFFVFYMDGNLRLIPHPPVGRSSVCFGSSVIVGSATGDLRPIAEVTSVRYVSTSKIMEVHYKNGGTAILDLSVVDRSIARVQVSINYPTDLLPFATFRSMFVTDGNADVDHVSWKDPFNNQYHDGIMSFLGGEGKEWFFNRLTHSQHNTSAPDIKILTGDQNLCICDNRFFVEVDYSTPLGDSGKAPAVPLTSDSGYFWFFHDTNVEILVKILDGREINGHFWFFWGAMTDVQYTITVTDMETGAVKTYGGEQGIQKSGNDINAF